VQAMVVSSQVQRRAIAVAIGGAGLIVAGLTLEPSGLLVAVAATSIWLGWQAGLVAIAISTVLFVAILFGETSLTIANAARLVVFLGASSAIWFLVHVFRTVSFFDVLDQKTMRTVEEDIHGLGWTAYPDGRMRHVNPAALEYVGVTPNQMRGIMDTDDHHWEQFVHPDDLESSRARWREALRTGEPIVDEARVRRHDGTYRWFRDTAVPSRDRHGRITGWYGHTTDIDDQRRAEAGLRASERELRLLVDTVPAMIYLMTTDLLPYYFNKRFADWAGIEPGDHAGEGRRAATGPEFVHPDDRVAAEEAFRRAFAGGDALQHKLRLRHKDGQFRWLDSRIEPLRDENGTIIRWYGVNIDIDDEVRAQEALRLADERLTRASHAASLSELSVSIAHELNQPLQAVVSNASAFQRWLGATPPNYERAGRAAERIIRDANAAADVLQRVRSLFRQSGQDRNLLDLNAIIREVCELITDKLVSNTVKLSIDLDPELPKLLVDRVQMEQVILNLMLNAMEAMESVEPRLRFLGLVSRREGKDAITIDVRDSGTGIVQPERIFEPFYTTKSDGMGMGLAICRSIIEAHAGRIHAKPIPEGGTSMSFTLPIRSAEPAVRHTGDFEAVSK
jgi:PAS domain S-box-containing protein